MEEENLILDRLRDKGDDCPNCGTEMKEHNHCDRCNYPHESRDIDGDPIKQF